MRGPYISMQPEGILHSTDSDYIHLFCAFTTRVLVSLVQSQDHTRQNALIYDIILNSSTSRSVQHPGTRMIYIKRRRQSIGIDFFVRFDRLLVVAAYLFLFRAVNRIEKFGEHFEEIQGSRGKGR